MKNKLNYEAPEAFVEDLIVQGVLCTSGDGDADGDVKDLGDGGIYEW